MTSNKAPKWPSWSSSRSASCSLPETQAYLQQVGERLVAAAGDPRWKFTFQIVDQEEPNAFAIPGGGIYVSRGLLILPEREDELAGVLAHEIAHVTQRHSAPTSSARASCPACSLCLAASLAVW